MSETNKINYSELLTSATKDTGRLLEAYRAFNNYSLQNTLLLMGQFLAREKDFAPVATFKQWTEKGYKVKKGEKALAMVVPCPIEKKDDNGEKTGEKFTFFKLVNRWFSFDQVEALGDDAKEIKSGAGVVNFDRDAILKAFNITEIKFAKVNGNVQGYATMKREIAINPLAQLPYKTFLHEVAHILCGHLDENETSEHGEKTPKNIMEVEAEGVAMLCLASLGLEGVEYCRGYIQNWLDEGQEIPEKSAKKIMNVADKILKVREVKEGAGV